MKTIIGFVSDISWVVKVYLRGKVLRQKAYCPRDMSQDGLVMFSGLSGMTVRRMNILTKWWRFRLLTVKEVMKQIQTVYKDKHSNENITGFN